MQELPLSVRIMASSKSEKDNADQNSLGVKYFFIGSPLSFFAKISFCVAPSHEMPLTTINEYFSSPYKPNLPIFIDRIKTANIKIAIIKVLLMTALGKGVVCFECLKVWEFGSLKSLLVWKFKT